MIPDGFGPNKALYLDTHINKGASLIALITPCEIQAGITLLVLIVKYDRKIPTDVANTIIINIPVHGAPK